MAESHLPPRLQTDQPAALKAEIAHRDGGLSRAISAGGLAGITLNILLGTALYVVPGEMARLGALSPLAMIGCGAAIAAVLLCLAEGASRAPSSGGIYGVVEAAFGRTAGMVAGGLTWTMMTFAGAAVLAASADQAAVFHTAFGGGTGRAAYVLAACAAFAWIAAGGARQSARAMQALVAIKLLALMLFLGLAVVALPATQNTLVVSPPLGVGKALILGVFAFMGAESALSVGGEVRDPARAVPRGVLGAMAIYALFGATIQWAVWRAGGAAIAGSTAPLAEIAQRAAGASAATVILIGALVASLGCVGGIILCAPRIVFAWARDGLLPAGLGHVGARSHAPARAIWLNAALIAALTLSGGYVALASFATLAGIAIYLAGATAALRLRARNVALAGPPLRWAATPYAGVGGMLALVVIAATASLVELAATVAAAALFAALAIVRAPRAGHARKA